MMPSDEQPEGKSTANGSSDETSYDETSRDASANPEYVLGQLAAAFTTSHEHDDPATKTRAGKKVQDWVKVFRGMMAGTLRIGSRTPVSDAPAWATPKVVQGGFVTGDLLADGPLEQHEQELLERLSNSNTALLDVSRGGQPRSVLNSHYLSEEGLAEMQRMVSTGHYRIGVPEEGTLPVIAWLLAHGHGEAARQLLTEIGPYLSRLRFYPVPNPQALTETSLVHLRTAGQTAHGLADLRVPERLRAQREATIIWAPLTDRAVDLFLETVEGLAPLRQPRSEGESRDSRSPVEGGWPCQHYPEGWHQRAQSLLDDYQRMKEQHQLCHKPERKGENFALLRGYLKVCVADPSRLTGRDVGMIRGILADVIARRGLPGSQRCESLRQFQAALAQRPAVAEIAQVVISRLAGFPPEEGVESLDEVLAPVTAEEAREHGLAAGLPLPERLGDKVRRCRLASVEDLVAENIITSAEVLAAVIPQITAQVLAAGLDDPDLRRLYGAIYQAFRRRRSLLLLNLESQVKFHELPWIQAVNTQWRQGTEKTEADSKPEIKGKLEVTGKAELAWQTLERAAVLSITSFPHQILPNKLLQELRALATDAGQRLPLVDEVAADIFMGAFAEKFLRAAQVAGTLLEGTLYERYYGLSYAQVQQIDDVRPASRQGTPTSPAFFQLCSELAGPGAGGSWVARNGTIIEQEQILTTHNLAVLFTALGLTDLLRPQLGELGRHNFAWICQRQQQIAPQWKARLQMVKNTAYAWRQMVFFLALAPQAEVEAFLVWASGHLDAQRPEFGTRFQPALEGLVRASQGLPTEKAEDVDRAGQPRRFLGWTMRAHWLLK